jgi:hypothetical protein
MPTQVEQVRVFKLNNRLTLGLIYHRMKLMVNVPRVSNVN